MKTSSLLLILTSLVFREFNCHATLVDIQTLFHQQSELLKNELSIKGRSEQDAAQAAKSYCSKVRAAAHLVDTLTTSERDDLYFQDYFAKLDTLALLERSKDPKPREIKYYKDRLAQFKKSLGALLNTPRANQRYQTYKDLPLGDRIAQEIQSESIEECRNSSTSALRDAASTFSRALAAAQGNDKFVADSPAVSH